MKVLKTCDLFKPENTGKIFTRKVDGERYRLAKHGTLYDSNGDYPRGINVNDDWEPIPQEVTWQEAIAAWVEGKKIRCEIDGEEFKYHIKGSMTISKMELRRGKWYIK